MYCGTAEVKNLTFNMQFHFIHETSNWSFLRLHILGYNNMN